MKLFHYVLNKDGPHRAEMGVMAENHQAALRILRDAARRTPAMEQGLDGVVPWRVRHRIQEVLNCLDEYGRSNTAMLLVTQREMMDGRLVLLTA